MHTYSVSLAAVVLAVYKLVVAEYGMQYATGLLTTSIRFGVVTLNWTMS
jgi:hypothetical protein